MYVRKMLKISSYFKSNQTYNSDDADDLQKTTQNSYFVRRKGPHNVLMKVSQWSIFCYHLKSCLIGLWVLLKWLFNFLWQSIQSSTKYQPTNALTSGSAVDYYGCVLHDKPPPCLVDNRIGLQSYVKLKVIKIKDTKKDK